MAGASQSAEIGAARAERPHARVAGPLARPREVLALVRLVAGGLMLLGVLLFVFGTSWDIQWHSFIGRDRALVPPHLLMLGGILLAGVAALGEIGVESVWAHANPTVAELSTPFAGAFYGSLGAYVAGFAALAAAVGFPLDVYWHSLYGIDVSVWAPFHVMIITGMSIVALGVAYLLLSGANLAGETGAINAARLGRLGVMVAAAAMLCALYFFLDAAFSNAALHLGPAKITTYPLMVGAFGGFALTLVAAAWPTRFAATGVALVYYLIDLVVLLLVPPITDALVVAEHQVYRRGQHPTLVVVSWLMPLTLIIAAAAIDLAANRARRRQRPLASSRASIGGASIVRAAVIGLGLVVLLDPLYLAFGFGGLRPLLDSVPLLLLYVAAFVLGLAGAWVGSRLGLEVGASLRRAER